MLHITPENVDLFCRTCLVQLETADLVEKYDIFHMADIQTWITDLTSMPAFENDGYSRYLCQKCFQKMRLFHKFRTKSIRAMQQLANLIMPNHVSKQELCDDIIISNDFDEENKIVVLTPEQYKQEHMSESEADIIESYDQTNDWVNKTEIEVVESVHESENSSDLVNTLLSATAKNCMCGANGLSAQLRHKKYEQNFPCTHCSRRCVSQENLDAHMRTHEGMKLLQCKKCDQSFSMSYQLSQHMRESHLNLLPTLPNISATASLTEEDIERLCRDPKFKTPYRLKQLMKPKKERKKETLICEECGRVFNNSTNLQAHRYIHLPKEMYPFKCEECGKRYCARRTYEEHLLRHAGIKNFQCPHCDKRTVTQKELLKHINLHTKEKKYPCRMCDKIFNSSSNLCMHVRGVHKRIRPYKCRFCDQTFGKTGALKYHEMRHTGEKPNACHICGRRFIQAGALRGHMKIHSKSGRKQNVKKYVEEDEIEENGEEEAEEGEEHIEEVEEMLVEYEELENEVY